MPIVFWLCLAVFFVGMFISCVVGYIKFDISYNELLCEQVTFEKYEVVGGMRHRIYEIYLEEFEEPFYISSITKKELNGDALERLDAGDAVKIYYRKNNHAFYDFEICEMKAGNHSILSLKDFKKANQNNQLIGIIVCPLGIVVSLIILYFVDKYK